MGLKSLRARDIMIRDIMTIGVNEVVAAARLKMVRQGIGGLPVVEDGKLVGMITHRDTILVGGGTAGLKVRDIMTKDVITVDEETPLRDIVDLMKETGFQRFPVVEDRRLVGIITQGCIINVLAEYL